MAVATEASSSPVDLLVNLGKNQSTKTLLRVIILCFIAGAAVASRLFSVIRGFLFFLLELNYRLANLPPHRLREYHPRVLVNFPFQQLPILPLPLPTYRSL